MKFYSFVHHFQSIKNQQKSLSRKNNSEYVVVITVFLVLSNIS